MAHNKEPAAQNQEESVACGEEGGIIAHLPKETAVCTQPCEILGQTSSSRPENAPA
jgi:hypothetical protein